MKIVCVGGGPAGLYSAVLAKLSSPGDEVTVVERNPPDATHSWGVTFGEDFLDDLHATTRDSAPGGARGRDCCGASRSCASATGPPVHLGGKYGYSLGRARLLEILNERCRQPGRALRVRPRDHLRRRSVDADLVVAADGVGSRLRAAHAEHFGTALDAGPQPLRLAGHLADLAGVHLRLRAHPGRLGVVLRLPVHGQRQHVHRRVRAADLDRSRAGHAWSPRPACGCWRRIFDRALEGHRLLEPPGGLGPAPWRNFREVRNATWRRGNTVLVGDAAHTTHFGIGSGTVLAVQDSIALAAAVRACGGDLATALPAYDARRRPALDPVQAMAAAQHALVRERRRPRSPPAPTRCASRTRCWAGAATRPRGSSGCTRPPRSRACGGPAARSPRPAARCAASAGAPRTPAADRLRPASRPCWVEQVKTA